MNLDKAKELAEAHWSYVEKVLLTTDPHVDVTVAKFHYISAFIHGFKHAYEELEAEVPRNLGNGALYMPLTQNNDNIICRRND